MKGKSVYQQSYFELVEHNTVQRTILTLIFLISLVTVSWGGLIFLQTVFKEVLSADLIVEGTIRELEETNEYLDEEADYFFKWVIDFQNSQGDFSRYWLNPTLAFFIPVLLISSVVSVVLTSLMPKDIGFMRQKIEREIARMLTRISTRIYGDKADDYHEKIIEEIKSADIRDLHKLEKKWKEPLEDLIVFHKAVVWRDNNLFYRITHFADGLTIYMRMYFTVKYNSTILGMVYIGAAILIVIIGLRGQKFIPSNKPSLVFFALSLEFTLLLTYALTLMFSKQEDEGKSIEQDREETKSIPLSADFGTRKEAQDLLKAFVKSDKNKN